MYYPGTTIAANGFYGPQGRELRLPLTDPELNRKIEAFDYNGQKDYELRDGELLFSWSGRSHGTPGNDRMLYYRRTCG